MGYVFTRPAGGNGPSSDELTASASDVIAGKTFVGSDTNDEAGTGTLALKNSFNGSPVADANGFYATIPDGAYKGGQSVTFRYSSMGITSAKIVEGESIGQIKGSAATTLNGTAAAGDVLAGKTFYSTNPKNKLTGTMVDRGNAQVGGGFVIMPSGSDYVAINQIPQGYYHQNGGDESWAPEIRYPKEDFYNYIGLTDMSKVWNGWTIAGKTGTMTVSSVVSFSVASISGVNATFLWRNPAKGPYGGVIIRYKTDGYPTSVSDGTQIYRGTGSNQNVNADSTATVTFPSGGMTYYCRIWMFCDTSNGTMYSGYQQVSVNIPVQSGSQTFTSSGIFTVPSGVSKIKVFLVGGGGGGNLCEPYSSSSSNGYGGGGGGGGYTQTAEYAVSAGQSCTVTIGAGGNGATYQDPSSQFSANIGYAGHAGSATSFRLPNGTTLTANGGAAGNAKTAANGNAGGSGGGAGGNNEYNEAPDSFRSGKSGGSDGGAGQNNTGTLTGGTGQGYTTRAYGEANATLYAGGGGGSAGSNNSNGNYATRGAGGAGGGGAGTGAQGNAENGAANTGGGGGGSSRYGGPNNITAGNGGSGICLIKWGY